MAQKSLHTTQFLTLNKYLLYFFKTNYMLKYIYFSCNYEFNHEKDTCKNYNLQIRIRLEMLCTNFLIKREDKKRKNS